MKLKGYLLACLSAATYGTIPLFAVPLMRQGIQFDTVLFYRFISASLFILLYLIAKKTSLKVTGKELLILIALGLLFAISSNLLFWSYEYLSAGIASTVLFIYPVFVALFMGIFYKEKISWVVWFSIALAFSGIDLLNHGEDNGVISLFGIILAGLSAPCYALYIVIVNKSCVRNMSGAKLTCYAMAFTALFFLVKSIIKGGLQPIPSFEVAGDIALFSIVCTVLTNIAMVYAVHYIGSTPTAIMGALEPIVAVAISVFLFAEPFTSYTAVGIVLIIIAVTFIILSERIQKISRNLWLTTNHKTFRKRL